MGYKTILSVLDDQKSARQISDFSLALAEQFEAHVIGLHCEAVAGIPMMAPMEMPDPVAVEAMQELAEQETAKIADIFAHASQRESISTEWRTIKTSVGASQFLVESGRCADLLVAAQGEVGLLSESRAEMETALFECGRPILLIPYILKTPKPIKRVLIAWDGSREASRAAFDALPFLKQAEAVEVFSVIDDSDGKPSKTITGAEFANTLARHGIKVTVTQEEKAGLGPAIHIENRLADASIDLLVMGAYSHKRWWEVLFGGVTRTVLDSMTALTLLSR
ncbi:universal stress protein [Rhizobium sp.]|jgi:nucleotide-binding universal stress UspA family protein|uniref:universal stress protein n=1 Tax=Rhizobium sp. TaxID=391 RepID=UPI000E8FFAA3|nr:universal stress protein [Rhizobium sp.]